MANPPDVAAAQVRLYNAQAEELERQKGDWAAAHRETISGVAALATLLTVAISLGALLLNQRAARRAQENTEFSEAIQRFGDVTSAPARASAAIALGRLGVRKLWVTEYEPNDSNRRLKRSRFYFDVVPQVVTAMRTEQDANVVDAMERAFGYVVRGASPHTKREIDGLQKDICDQLTRLVAGFMEHLATWKNDHGDIALVTERERDLYEPLLVAEAEFRRDPAAAIAMLTGADTDRRTILNACLANAAWDKLSPERRIDLGRGSLKPRAVGKVRRELEMLLKKLVICNKLQNRLELMKMAAAQPNIV